MLPDVPEISNPWYLNKDVWHTLTRNFQHLIHKLLNFSPSIGSCIGSETDEDGRPTESGTVHESQTQEDFLFVAYLSPNIVVYPL